MCIVLSLPLLAPLFRENIRLTSLATVSTAVSQSISPQNKSFPPSSWWLVQVTRKTSVTVEWLLPQRWLLHSLRTVTVQCSHFSSANIENRFARDFFKRWSSRRCKVTHKNKKNKKLRMLLFNTISTGCVGGESRAMDARWPAMKRRHETRHMAISSSYHMHEPLSLSLSLFLSLSSVKWLSTWAHSISLTIFLFSQVTFFASFSLQHITAALICAGYLWPSRRRFADLLPPRLDVCVLRVQKSIASSAYSLSRMKETRVRDQNYSDTEKGLFTMTIRGQMSLFT